MQTILDKNQERLVRCTASLARASIAELAIDGQAEAEQLYDRFLAEFDGKTKSNCQGVEQLLNQFAGERLVAMQFAPIGRPAPEILGVDHQGIFRKRWTGEPPIDVLNRMVDELVAQATDK